MDQKRLKELQAIDHNRVTISLCDMLRGYSPIDRVLASAYAVAYVFLHAKEKGYPQLDNPASFIREYVHDEDIRMFLENAVPESWDRIKEQYNYFSKDELLAFILYDDGSFEVNNFGTPLSLCLLSVKLLNIQETDTVADFGTGKGGFLIRAYNACPNAKYYGNEIHTAECAIAKIRASLLNGDIRVAQLDMFTVDKSTMKFDKVFSNYPFGMRLQSLQNGQEFLDRLQKAIPSLKRATSSDWIFNSLLIESIKQGGKAVGIMTIGSTWNSIDKPLREYFIRKGYVETIIQLPDKLFDFTGISTALIVLSHGNKSVRLVDASGICHIGRRHNELSLEDIEKITWLVDNDAENSKSVQLEELMVNDFSLSPVRFLTNSQEIKDGVPFGDVIKRITRGAPCTADELDNLVSNEPTDMQYLMLANIHDGDIDEDLPYLSEIEPRFEKYCLRDGALILSKNGYPFKVAIAHVKPGTQILANGNLFVIELDERKINPYYLKAYFESEQGIAALKSIAVGASIPNISAEQLKKLVIPLAPMDEQDKISSQYQAVTDEIAILRMRLKKAMGRLKDVFPEGRM